MGETFFDDLARALAEPMPRRKALRLLAAGLTAAAVPGLRVRGAFAASKPCVGSSCFCTTGGTPCGYAVPPRGFNLGCCIGAPGERRTVCCTKPPDGGSWCCPKGYTCGSGANTPTDRNCTCNGVELPDGTCGPCPSGEVQCGKQCCKGRRPTLPAEVCYQGRCQPGCPDNTKKCGNTCCTKKQGCKNGKCCDKCGGSGTCCNPATQFCCREPGKPKSPGRCCKKNKETCCGVGPPGAQKRQCCAKPNKCARQLPPTIGGITASSPYVCCPPKRQVPNDTVVCCAPGQVSLGGKLVVGPGIQGLCCDENQVCGEGADITCCPTGTSCLFGTCT
jgi:hypothetical protein